MTEDTMLGVFKEAMLIVFSVAGPLLIVSMIVGLVIAILQAATQVHEQTLTFVPKALTIALILLLLGSFYMSKLEGFMAYIFDIISQVSSKTSVI